MNAVSYLSTLVVSFIGLFIGLALAYISPEELKPGERYFVLLQKIILGFIVFVFVYQLNFNFIITIILFVIAMLFLFYTKPSPRLLYILLGIIFFFSSINKEMFLLVSALIFLYGFPTGTLFVKKMIKKPKLFVIRKLLIDFYLFLIVGLILYFINGLL